MAVVKKAPVVVLPDPSYQQELERLYERRSALEALIASLEEYELFLKTADTNRKTA